VDFRRVAGSGDSLQMMWNSIAGRLQSPHPHRVHADLHDAERLEIPILELGLAKQFKELHGVMVDGLGFENQIGIARESILFRLDETGAELIAEAESMVVGENGFPEIPFDPTKPRRFVFDQPFFIALREKDASEPYFLGWIAHPEVMVRSAQ
jgi:serine protease inhibitor